MKNLWLVLTAGLAIGCGTAPSGPARVQLGLTNAGRTAANARIRVEDTVTGAVIVDRSMRMESGQRGETIAEVEGGRHHHVSIQVMSDDDSTERGGASADVDVREGETREVEVEVNDDRTATTPEPGEDVTGDRHGGDSTSTSDPSTTSGSSSSSGSDSLSDSHDDRNVTSSGDVSISL